MWAGLVTYTSMTSEYRKRKIVVLHWKRKTLNSVLPNWNNNSSCIILIQSMPGKKPLREIFICDNLSKTP